METLMRAAVILVLCALTGCAGVAKIEPVEVKVLFSFSGFDDQSIGANILSGLIFARSAVFARNEENIVVDSFVPESQQAAEDTLNAWLDARDQRQLVIIGAAQFAPLVEGRACDFGTSSVLQLDTSLPTCANLRSVTYRSFGPAYLAGVAAVSDPLQNPDGTVGIIGGSDIPAVRELIDGFTAGVEASGGTVVSTEFISPDPAIGFNDPAAGRALAQSMIPSVGVIYAAAGESGIGVAEVLDSHFDANPNDPVLYVGSDVDQSGRYGRITLASVLKRLDITVRDATLDAVGGSFFSGDVRVGFPDGSTEVLLHPRRAVSVVSGDCSQCDAYEPSCYAMCRTLEDVVDDAVPAALAAQEAYGTTATP